jgi:hypothetical protein
MTTPARHPGTDDDPTQEDPTQEDPAREGYYLVIPDEVVQSATQRTAGAGEYGLAGHDEDLPEREPMSRSVVSTIGGVTTSLVVGLIPSLFVAPPASLVSGAAAGVFGGLMGASLAAEFYDRRHREPN